MKAPLGLGLAAVAWMCSAAVAQTVPPMPSSEDSPSCMTGTGVPATEVRLPQIGNALANKRKITILTIGASAASRTPSRDYYDIIERYLERTFKGLDVEILDRGVSGELARDAAERIKLEVALEAIDLVIWQVGTFDALARVAPEEIEQTLTGTAQWLRAHKIDLVFVGLHYVRSLQTDVTYQAIREAVRRVAAEQGVLRIGRYEAGEALAKARLGASIDDFDATSSGYACMAETVARALTAGLFGKMMPP
jgi:acyl-CoA thioesterase-1